MIWKLTKIVIWFGIVFLTPFDSVLAHYIKKTIPNHIHSLQDTVTVGQHFDVTVRDSAGKRVKYVLAAWDTGTQKIVPGGAVQGVGKDSLLVPKTSATVYVKSVLPKDTALQKPKPLRSSILIRPFDWLSLIYAAIILALLGLFYWIWKYLKKRKNRPLDAYKAAKQEFQKIKSIQLLESGHTRQYVSLHVSVTRRYLSERIPRLKLSHTTRQLEEEIERGPVHDPAAFPANARVSAAKARTSKQDPSQSPLTRDLKALLEGADQAKFAPQTITKAEAELIAKESERIVDETERWLKAVAEARKQSA